MCDRSMAMRAAVVALSPVADLAADPMLYNRECMNEWSSACAKPSELRIPYALPVNGNFSNGSSYVN
jgi:hypothetical protein